MATLDVSEALDCAEFQTAFSIIRRPYHVNDDGETALDENAAVDATGVIQAASGKDIERLPEALRTHDAIRIYSKVILSSDSAGNYSDIVVYQNLRWQVKIVDDWSNWGTGYVKIIAVMVRATDG